MNKTTKVLYSVAVIILILFFSVIISKKPLNSEKNLGQNLYQSNEVGTNMAFQCYNRNGQTISCDQRSKVNAIIDGTEQGIEYIKFTLTVLNSGQIDLSSVSFTPSANLPFTASTPIAIVTGVSTQWTSDLIPTAQYIGTQQTFSTDVTATYTYANKVKTMTESISKTLSFAVDLVADVTLTLENTNTPFT